MGSNLNLSGEIECDASIMDGKSLHYGAVGAISGELHLLYQYLRKVTLWWSYWGLSHVVVILTSRAFVSDV